MKEERKLYIHRKLVLGSNPYNATYKDFEDVDPSHDIIVRQEQKRQSWLKREKYW